MSPGQQARWRRLDIRLADINLSGVITCKSGRERTGMRADRTALAGGDVVTCGQGFLLAGRLAKAGQSRRRGGFGRQ
ncbi:hypothetical protein FMN50_16450 [Rhodobacterales bacterium]|nr:hypothetical protein FMN50_16450 [Rhodobacterales bacterium]